MKKYTIVSVNLIAVVIVLCSFQENKRAVLKNYKWLLGSWVSNSLDATIFEVWEEKSSIEFIGKSFTVKGNDTIILETISILQEGSKLKYIPTVTDQNEGLPIQFMATYFSKNKLIFENATHDFPQAIIYKKITKDSLVATISGIQKGKDRQEEFFMKRMSN